MRSRPHGEMARLPALPETQRGPRTALRTTTGRPVVTYVRRVAALAAACTFILPASAQAAGYADGVLADGPLTYLRLAETSGTVAPP
jgi:hypothetical protein